MATVILGVGAALVLRGAWGCRVVRCSLRLCFPGVQQAREPAELGVNSNCVGGVEGQVGDGIGIFPAPGRIVRARVVCAQVQDGVRLGMEVAAIWRRRCGADARRCALLQPERGRRDACGW